jgi:hypothetical protein
MPWTWDQRYILCYAKKTCLSSQEIGLFRVLSICLDQWFPTFCVSSHAKRVPKFLYHSNCELEVKSPTTHD